MKQLILFLLCLMLMPFFAGGQDIEIIDHQGGIAYSNGDPINCNYPSYDGQYIWVAADSGFYRCDTSYDAAFTRVHAAYIGHCIEKVLTAHMAGLTYLNGGESFVSKLTGDGKQRPMAVLNDGGRLNDIKAARDGNGDPYWILSGTWDTLFVVEPDSVAGDPYGYEHYDVLDTLVCPYIVGWSLAEGFFCLNGTGFNFPNRIEGPDRVVFTETNTGDSTILVGGENGFGSTTQNLYYNYLQNFWPIPVGAEYSTGYTTTVEAQFLDEDWYLAHAANFFNGSLWRGIRWYEITSADTLTYSGSVDLGRRPLTISWTSDESGIMIWHGGAGEEYPVDSVLIGCLDPFGAFKCKGLETWVNDGEILGLFGENPPDIFDTEVIPGTGRMFVVGHKVIGATGTDYADIRGVFEVAVSNIPAEFGGGETAGTGSEIEVIRMPDDGAVLTIGPNPTGGIVEITAEQAISRIQIFDLDGQSLRLDRTVANTQQATINLSDLPPGVYLLWVHLANGALTTRKLVKK